MKKLHLLLLLICCCRVLFAGAQTNNLYEKRLYISGADTMPYRLLLPKNYDASVTYPLVLFLHGAGERGNDNEAQLVHGGSLFLQDSVRNNYPAIVVFPQCSADSYWSNVTIKLDSVAKKRRFEFTVNEKPTKAMKQLLALIKDLEQTYKLDSKRHYIGGLSMGGMGTFEVVGRKPNYYAAAFPICGGANPLTAKNLKKPSWWVFHGAKDDVVPSVNSERMVAALKEKGADVKFTLYPNANHNSWDDALAEKDLLPWLFSHQKK